MWEDEHNLKGGKFSMIIPKQLSNKYWEDLVLTFIGEKFSVDNEITGLVINLKSNKDTIQIWTRNSQD